MKNEEKNFTPCCDDMDLVALEDLAYSAEYNEETKQLEVYMNAPEGGFTKVVCSNCDSESDISDIENLIY